jgi:PAS fold
MKQWELRGITIDDAPPSTSGAEPEPPRSPDAEPQIVVDRFPMVFWTTDGELGFTSSPAPGVLHLGLPPDRFTGKTLFDLFEAEEVEIDVLAAHLRALRGKATTFAIRGRGRTFRCWVSPLQRAGGRPIGTICVGLDDQTAEEVREPRAPFLQLV